MRIAIHVDGRQIRGSERQVLLLARGLRDLGHDLHVACDVRSDTGAALRALGVATTSSRPRGDVDAVSFARWVLWLRRTRPDVLLVTSWKRMPAAALGARLAGVPRVVLRLGTWQEGIRRGKYRIAMTRLVDATYVNSRTLGALLEQRAPWLARERVHVVINALDSSVAAPAALRHELVLDARAVLIAGVGGLEHRKGFDLLIDALAALDEPAAHIVLAGEGPARQALRARAERAGVAGRVHLLGQRADVPAVLSACDAFVLSSRNEGMAVAMMEAMAVGTPVIAADISGSRDAVDAREDRPPAGWIVAPESSGAIADALRELLRLRTVDPDAVSARTAEARWRVEHWFSPARTVIEVEALLRGTAAPAPLSPP